MTRLTAADLAGLGDWAAYDRLIQGALGVDLPALAALAAGRPTAWVAERLRGRRLAAVSVSAGQGVLPGFAETLAAIGRRLGLTSAAMPSPDADGLREAEAWGADLVIQADDDRFQVLDLAGGRAADNNPATSRAFVAALELLNGGSLAGREVLVLGLGIIGRGAAARLLELEAWPLLYDPDSEKGPAALAEAGGGEVVANADGLARALGRTKLIFEAVPHRKALPERLMAALLESGSARVAAPGVPLSWPAAWLKPGGPARLWHDPLPSGVAAMLALVA
ncbi:3-methylornithyl-N6-L-lysine dehydrogenase PylD [Deltaproteobacteria bacterium]|nr:3-methylornithyl-N6-L-lysine dehydrogenase PylD [Deltaproteobacteria bacterium]